MKHIIITTILLSSISLSGLAQKVKYKDLFILLNAENYTDADVYLRQFLVENPEHANANYNMGRMLQSYIYEVDLLNNNDRVIELADSSQLYFDNAKRFITEKEVKKHDDDYYAEFRRRDLRTGKFSVKFHDVELDIDNRKEILASFKADVVKLKLHFSLALMFYDSCQKLYTRFIEKAPTTNHLYFTANANDLQTFRDISTIYDSCNYNFNTYRVIMKGMGKGAVNQEVEFIPIKKYAVDGISRIAPFAETVNFWNFKEWAFETHNLIGKQIYPLKKRMVSFDATLRTMHDKVVKDTIDARAEIFKLATENVARDLRDYNVTSLPAAIFNFRIAEINYHSAINFWYKEVQDTIDVGVKFDLLTDLRKQFNGISTLMNKLSESNIQEEKYIFKDYLEERYAQDGGIDEYLKLQEAEVYKDSLLVMNWAAQVDAQDKITLWQADSISLIVGNQIINKDSVRYSTVLIDTLYDRKLGFYVWKEAYDSLSFSFSISPSSRILDTLYSIPINPLLVEQRMLNLQYITDSVAIHKRIWVLNSSAMAEDSTYAVQVFNTDLNVGSSWSKQFNIASIPKSVKYSIADHLYTLYGISDESLLVLDEFGEMIIKEEEDNQGHEEEN